MRSTLALATALTLCAAAAHADLHVVDNTFADADWSVVKAQDTTIPGDAVGTGAHSPTGASPAPTAPGPTTGR